MDKLAKIPSGYCNSSSSQIIPFKKSIPPSDDWEVLDAEEVKKARERPEIIINRDNIPRMVDLGVDAQNRRRPGGCPARVCRWPGRSHQSGHRSWFTTLCLLAGYPARMALTVMFLGRPVRCPAPAQIQEKGGQAHESPQSLWGRTTGSPEICVWFPAAGKCG